jgi:hypothetical protein
MSSNDMPSPDTRDAPKFHYENPRELCRFIRRVEELFEKHGVKSDTVKIKYLGAYADARTEREWEAMTSSASGNFTMFKKEIIESYPEADNEMRGSMIELKRIISCYSNLKPDDLVQLQAFRRAFTAEAKKLQADPPLLSNHEIVNLFLQPLDESFRERIVVKLDLARTVKSTPDKDVRTEDRFTLKEIIETAISIARSSQTSYSSDNHISLKTEPVKNASARIEADSDSDEEFARASKVWRQGKFN